MNQSAESTTGVARTVRPAGDSRRLKAAPTTRRLSPAHRRDGLLAFFLLIPAGVGFALFAAYPAIRGAILSFSDDHVLAPPIFTGMENYQRLLGDGVFWHSLGVTCVFVLISVGGGLLISLLTAVILHRVTRSALVRGLVLLPFLVSSVVAALVWQWMLDPGLGIVNVAIKALSGHTVMFLGSSDLVIPSLAFISIWKSMGYNAILIFAGLQTIPNQLYEAARIDGASEPRMFASVTLPLLRPILAMVVVLSVISSFQVFDLVNVTTAGGPANASNVLPVYIYKTGFGEFDFGYALTMSMALFVLLLALTFVQLRLFRANETDTD